MSKPKKKYYIQRRDVYDTWHEVAKPQPIDMEYYRSRSPSEKPEEFREGSLTSAPLILWLDNYITVLGYYDIEYSDWVAYMPNGSRGLIGKRIRKWAYAYIPTEDGK